MHGFQAIGPSTTLEYATTGVFAETPRFPKNTQEGNLHESLHNPHGMYYIRSSYYDILSVGLDLAVTLRVVHDLGPSTRPSEGCL